MMRYRITWTKLIEKPSGGLHDRVDGFTNIDWDHDRYQASFGSVGPARQ